MNRTHSSLLFVLPFAAVLAASAEASPAVPVNPQPGGTLERGRISRVLGRPGERPEGLLLRNGTFVDLPPGLQQRLPASLAKNTPVQVSGEMLRGESGRTMVAHSITIAGIGYDEGPAPVGPGVGPAAGPVAGGPPAPPPPPPPCAVGGPRPPAPPPPPGPGGMSAPPAPPSAGVNAPAPPNSPAPPAPPAAGDAPTPPTPPVPPTTK